MFDLIVSRGRVADRKASTLTGAAQTAEALERHYGVIATVVGVPMPPADDDWTVSLAEAHETLLALQRATEEGARRGRLQVVVSSTCSASLASLPVIAREHPDAVVIWFDAHGDFNTPATTETGYLGGMVLAAACGLWESGFGAGLRAEQLMIVGARDIDQSEREMLRSAGVRLFTPVEAAAEAILQAIGHAPVWVHIDWDGLEPGFVPADYDVPHGLLPEQLRAILAAIPSKQIIGIELAEYSAPPHADEAERALSTILAIIAPLFACASNDLPSNQSGLPAA
jgi:arginase/N-omega-hydroxy-L-arginine amidinohydrolase